MKHYHRIAPLLALIIFFGCLYLLIQIKGKESTQHKQIDSIKESLIPYPDSCK